MVGKIYAVALLYKRALSATEIATHYQLGLLALSFGPTHSHTVGRTVQDGLVALYIFSEGDRRTVGDVSHFRGAVEPTHNAKNPRAPAELADGIEIVEPAIIKSERPAQKLADAFRGRDELSIEVWWAPDNLTQTGPARLVSFSGGTAKILP